MAKGARRKTKWVSLSLANTSTSVATGSDSEQQPPHASHQHYGAGGHRQKTFNGADTNRKYSSSGSKDSGAGADSSEEHTHTHETLDTRSGTRTDTSGTGSGSDCPNGNASLTDRRTGFHRRHRVPPYNTRSGWTGGGTGTVTNGRGTYGGGNRTGYYNAGGYYGTGRRSYCDTRTPRSTNGTSTDKTTSGGGDGDGGGGEGRTPTINDDEYTRITTPRQDVLFKKGYLSRPKPTVTATASTSNENTASSSIAGTTSDGSENGRNGGGSNSISTTASITSEGGGSFAADGSPLFDYPYPFLPCGYFTENGVLVMNGFAVDNNGYSYFNGGQTYIYPPSFNNCQQQPTDAMPYPANDETNANGTDDQPEPVTPDEGEMPTEEVGAPGPDNATPTDDLCSVDVGAGGDGDDNPAALPATVSVEQAPALSVPPEFQDTVPAEANAAGDGVPEGEVAVPPTTDVPDYENGFYQFTDVYDFAQFYSSIYYPNWLMEQYRMYDDSGAPMYCAGEYAAMPNGDVYSHQTSFKRRKKRFRTFEEIAGDDPGAAYDQGDMHGAMLNGRPAVSEEVLLSDDGVVHQECKLNVDVKEFQPTTSVAAIPGSNETCASSESGATQNDQSNSPVVTNKPPPVAKLPKSTPPKATPSGPVNGLTATTSIRPVAAAVSHKTRKKDLIESTLAFAEQNIDLTRSKALANASASLDSELECWTTVDRNGRKKRAERMDTVKDKSVPASSDQREVLLVKSVPSPLPATVNVQLASTPTVAASTVDVSSSGSSLNNANSTGPVEECSKKDSQTTKSKKKAKSNKRQQHRKTGAGHRQQKQEGFQLIEPDFASAVTIGRPRGKGAYDKAANDDLTREDDLLEEHDGEMQSKEEPETVSKLEVIVEHSVGDSEQVRSKELTCDKTNNETVPAGAPQPTPVEVIEEQRDAQEMVLATTAPPLSPPQLLFPLVVVEEPIIIEKTEKDLQQHRPEQPCAKKEAEQAMKELQLDTVLHQKEQHAECLMEHTEQVVTEVPIADPLQVPAKDTHNGTQSPAVEQERLEVSTDRCVLSSAAKPFAYADRPNLLLANDKDAIEEEAEDEEIRHGEADVESRRKRGSVVSGVGYTESIDSGLQSPVSPCGGVASPEASSMVSSIESDGPTMDRGPAEAPLSQVVAKWLLRKLEVHEPEEVFVLPSNPLLIDRLARFQLLQRRGGRLHERNFSSDSEDGDDFGDGSQDDSDSDYMSDGQGRLQRTGGASDTNPSSPANGIVQPFATESDASQKQPNAKITHAPLEEAAPTKQLILNPNDSLSTNSPVGAPRAAAASAPAGDAKRCVIM